MNALNNFTKLQFFFKFCLVYAIRVDFSLYLLQSRNVMNGLKLVDGQQSQLSKTMTLNVLLSETKLLLTLLFNYFFIQRSNMRTSSLSYAHTSRSQKENVSFKVSKRDGKNSNQPNFFYYYFYYGVPSGSFIYTTQK